MSRKIDAPFSSGWIGFGLEGYRACDSTYCWYAYETLPPLPDVDPTFAWLIPERQAYYQNIVKNPEGEAEFEAQEQAKLVRLVDEAARLGLQLPENFVNYIHLWHLIGIWWCNICSIADHLISCPGFPGAYLLGFVRDYQDCVTWALCLTQSGEHCVMALYIGDDLPEHRRWALHGDLEFWWEGEALTDEHFFTPTDEAPPIEDIFICAPTFEEFIYRVWLEHVITEKLDSRDKTPLTEPQRRYLAHYARDRAK